MTEALPVGVYPYSVVLTYNDPAELPPFGAQHTLAVTLEPLALFARDEDRWVPVASVEGNVPAPTVVHASETEVGVVELATAGEAAAGADATRAVHPLGLKAAMAPGVWVAPTLLGGWVNYVLGAAEAGYRKDASGWVELKGLIKNGTATNGTVLFTLPVGHRPAEQRNFSIIQGNNTASRLAVGADGAVSIWGVTSNAFLTLDGVRFGV